MAWLTPDEIPEGTACRPLFIPDNPSWLAIVSGAILELTRTWNWEAFGAVTPEQAAQRMQVMMQEYYVSLCENCDVPIEGKPTRVGEDGAWQEFDNGEWGEPTGERLPPPVPVRDEPTAAERRCLAAANAALVFEEMYEQAVDYWNSNVDPAAAFTAWIGVGSTKIMVALGFLSAGSSAFLLAFWSIFYAAIEFVSADEWTAEFDDKFKCMLYECSDDNAGVVTFNWSCVIRRLTEETDWLDPLLGEQRLALQIMWMFMLVGIQGINLAGATEAVTEADCDDCNDQWCVYFDFAEEDCGFEQVPAAPSNGVYVSGQGWEPTLYLPQAIRQLYITRDFPECTVIYLEMGFDAVRGVFPEPIPTGLRYLSGNVIVEAPTTTGNEQVRTWSGVMTPSGIRILAVPGNGLAGSGDPGGSATVRYLKMIGTGERPFDLGIFDCPPD